MAPDRFKVIAAVHLFLFKKGKVLLARRCNTGWGDGLYSVPAGHVDGAETMIQAMVREAREEVGITIVSTNLKVVHVMHRLTSDSERVDFFLATEEWRGIPEIKESDKCDDLRWFDLEKLPNEVIPYIKSALKNVSAGVTYSEFGWES